MQPTYTLYIYTACSGQISGRVYKGDSEVFGIAGCASASEVEEAVQDAGYEDYLVVLHSP